MAIGLERPGVKHVVGRPQPRARRRGFGMGHIVTLLALLLGSVAAGYFGYQRYLPPKPVVEATTTAPVSRGTIAATVTIAGSTAAKSQAKLAFESAGLLTELAVKVGAGVKAGDALARLDTSDLKLQVAQAEVSLEQAKVKLAQLREGPKEVEVAAARASYESALTKYDQLKAGATPEDVSAAQIAVRDAEVALTNSKNSLTVTQKSATVSKNVRDRQDEHQWYEAKYGDTVAKQARGEASQSDVDREWANLLTAKERLDSARAEAELALRRAETDVIRAEESVTKANDNLQKLLAGAGSEQLKSAEATLLNAKAQLDAKTSGTSATDIASQEVAVRLAESALKQKQLLIDKAVLKAPFDGVIDSIAVNSGEQVSASKEVMALVNMRQFTINARVDETQVARLAIGQTAAVTLDALPDQRLSATVSSIGATATSQQGVVSYPVVLELQSTEQPVRPGMTANIVVEVARRDNVLLVPNRAVRTQGRNRTVAVLVDGQQQTRTVTVGMSNDQFTEVASGLQENDLVVIPTTTTAQPRVPQAGGFGVPGAAIPVPGGFGR